eukprot:467867-Amphidinium_carterae.1
METRVYLGFIALMLPRRAVQELAKLGQVQERHVPCSTVNEQCTLCSGVLLFSCRFAWGLSKFRAYFARCFPCACSDSTSHSVTGYGAAKYNFLLHVRLLKHGTPAKDMCAGKTLIPGLCYALAHETAGDGATTSCASITTARGRARSSGYFSGFMVSVPTTR